MRLLERHEEDRLIWFCVNIFRSGLNYGVGQSGLNSSLDSRRLSATVGGRRVACSFHFSFFIFHFFCQYDFQNKI